MLRKLVLSNLLLVMSLAVMAQATTATIAGQITNTKGEALPSSTVTVTLTTTGTKHNILTLQDGRFTIPNLRVGGPYTIEISHVGYHSKTIDNVMLNLGHTFAVDEVLIESAGELGAIVVV